jgi:hypothetical protein
MVVLVELRPACLARQNDTVVFAFDIVAAPPPPAA